MNVLILLTTLLTAQGKSPFVATGLSVLPGGGQFYTDNRIKGIVFSALQSTFAFFTIAEHIKTENAYKKYKETRDMEDYAEYEKHFKKRYTLLWWDAGIWTLSMSDAYVSAHFYKFKEAGSPGRGSPKGEIKVGFRF